MQIQIRLPTEPAVWYESSLFAKPLTNYNKLLEHPKNLNNWPYSREMPPKDADGIANSEDPDQQSDLGLHCLPRPVCLKT